MRVNFPPKMKQHSHSFEKFYHKFAKYLRERFQRPDTKWTYHGLGIFLSLQTKFGISFLDRNRIRQVAPPVNLRIGTRYKKIQRLCNKNTNFQTDREDSTRHAPLNLDVRLKRHNSSPCFCNPWSRFFVSPGERVARPDLHFERRGNGKYAKAEKRERVLHATRGQIRSWVSYE